MKLDYNMYNGNRLQGIFRTRRRMINYLLLHGRGTKCNLSMELGITFPAVTAHVNALLESGMVLSAGSIQTGKKRRTEEFVLAESESVCGAVSLTAERISLYTLSLRGEILGCCDFPVGCQDREHLFSAFWNALYQAKRSGMISVLVSVDGIISSERQVWFHVNQVKDWEPCSPTQLCRNRTAGIAIELATRIRTLARGWGQRMGSLDRIGVIEYCHDRMKASCYHEGSCDIGLIGTESQHFHVSLEGGEKCYCGREHCFVPGIHRGIHTREYLGRGLQLVAENLGADRLGFYAPGQEGMDFSEYGLMTLENPEEIFQSGLSMLGAEHAWLQVLRCTFAPDL